MILTAGSLILTGVSWADSLEEEQIAQVMVEQVETVPVRAGSLKFNKIASFTVCNLDQGDSLICEQRPPDELVRSLHEGCVTSSYRHGLIFSFCPACSSAGLGLAACSFLPGSDTGPPFKYFPWPKSQSAHFCCCHQDAGSSGLLFFPEDIF